MIIIFHEVVWLACYVWRKLSDVFRYENYGERVENNFNPGNVQSSFDSNISTNQLNTENIPPLNKESSLSLGSANSQSAGLPHNDPLFDRSTDRIILEENDCLEANIRKGDHRESLDLASIIHCIDRASREDGQKLIYDVEPTCGCEEKGMKFIPPVYVQRYMAIQNVLNKPCWSKNVKKVVDFGCAELSFETNYLKRLHGIEEILAVDVDLFLLDSYKERVRPTPTNYLEPRPSPLTIKVICGSVGNTNEVLMNTDAVIAIELIEHLFPPDLEQLPFTVFGYIKPKIVILTTPNSDFNVLFPNLNGFRHDDHKFEWTRHQFEDWCNNLVQRYSDYSVSFQGIGQGPTGTENLGCCSQMATFVRLNNEQFFTEDEMHVQDGEYTVLEEFVYPYFEDKRTKDEIIKENAVSFLQRCVLLRNLYEKDIEDENKKNHEIPLSSVMERTNCHNKEKLRNILMAENWEIKCISKGHEVVILPDSDHENDYQDSNSEDDNTSELSDSDQTPAFNHTLVNYGENWDCDEKTAPKMLLSNTITTECACFSNKTVTSPKNSVSEKKNECSAQSEKLESCLTNENISKMCSLKKDSVPDSCCETISFNSTFKHKSSLEKCDLDCTVYKTPYNHSFKPVDSSNNMSSLYATPCSEHMTPISKCLSFQQISVHNSSPILQTELNNASREPIDQFSEFVEELDMHESYNNGSKVVDSGYCQDSYSHIDMDIVSSPEQIDDIEIESEGPLPSLIAPVSQTRIAQAIDNVQNINVVNNNRDGEGNNVVVDIEEEEIEFEAQIEVVAEIQSFAAIFESVQVDKKNCRQHQEMDCEIFEEFTEPTSKKVQIESLSLPYCKLNGQETSKSLRPESNTNANGSKSQSRPFNTLNSTLDSCPKDIRENCSVDDTGNVASHNSLTTILDGCSKFSNCSIVCSKPENGHDWKFSEEVAQNINLSRFENETSHKSKEYVNQQDHHSVVSKNWSVESLQKSLDDCSNEFPSWLLNMELDFTDESSFGSRSSAISQFDNISFVEEESAQNFDVQGDVRGGGDPLRGTWL